MKNLLKARTIFAFMFYATFCYLVVEGRDVPQALNSIISIIMGAYFGSTLPKNKEKNHEVNN